jgi:hypothetical protein
MLNLHFLNPFFKCNCAQFCNYEIIFKLIDVISDDEKEKLLEDFREKVKGYKELLI